MSITEWEISLRLVLSCILGGLIGLERESLDRPAGFRTHILVCVGSALIMVVSMYAFVDYDTPNKDPGRIAAQVVSGIGFLGAGTIIREGLTVKGLTTAASLWVVAGIGLAIGSGFYFAGIASTGLVFLTLVLFGHLERRYLTNKSHHRLNITIADQPGQLGRIGFFLGQHGISIRNIIMQRQPASKTVDIELVLRIPPDTDLTQVVQHLIEVDGVRSVDKLS